MEPTITQIWSVKNGPRDHVNRMDTSEIFITALVIIVAIVAICTSAAMVLHLI